MVKILLPTPTPTGSPTSAFPFVKIPNIPSISTIGIPGLHATPAQILSHPTWDIVLIFTMIAIGFFYGLSRGRHKMISSVINTYVSLAVFNAAPITAIAQYVKTGNLFVIKTVVFFAIFLPLVFLMNRGRPRYFKSNISWWQVFLLSFIQTGLLIHIVFSFLSPEVSQKLAPFTRSFFANTNLTVWWLSIPLIFMIFLRRSGKDD
ncbi:MAG: hypothetical protein Q8R30_00280 [bacterium]|nr:hypothetical protein [bacterium]MDZ4286303.1 hypothetical protein [Candidatus Sungbacteria bacterium]